MGGKPSRGEVWWVDLYPTRGHEQRGIRPALVVSANRLNHGNADLAWIVPITRTALSIPFHLELEPPEGGVTERSYLKCEDLRSVSVSEQFRDPLGVVTPATMTSVEGILRVLLDIY
jgi:mRNA interferase MazF